MNSLKLAACVALVFFTTISAQALTIPSEESGAHEIFCRENNTERGVLNKNHFEFCMEKQHKSYIACLSA
jgi:hypothetical protein